jgi:non-homologous end joining protein Ku
VKGHEYKKGLRVLEDETSNANPRKTQTIDIVEFIDEKKSISSSTKSPSSEPTKQARKAYALLREAPRKRKWALENCPGQPRTPG